MSKLRSVSTAFWSDPFVEELTPNQKLLFLYLITNEKTNMLGIYEVSIRKISFETGLKKDDIEKGLSVFKKLGKVNYIENYVILINYMKHQKFNPNMKKSAIDVYNGLPNKLKNSNLVLSKDKASEGFESLLKHYGMVPKYEVEDKEEDEEENNIDFSVFWEMYGNKTKKKDCIALWNKITNKNRKKIIDTLPAFLKHKPFETYTHPTPEYYLKKERWEDELPEQKPKPETKEIDYGDFYGTKGKIKQYTNEQNSNSI